MSIYKSNYHLITKFLSDEMIKFLGDFVIESCEYSKSYTLICKDGRRFFGTTHGDILDTLEKEYSNYLKLLYPSNKKYVKPDYFESKSIEVICV